MIIDYCGKAYGREDSELAALEQGIPVIAVRENRNRMRNELGKLPFGPGKLFIVRKLS